MVSLPHRQAFYNLSVGDEEMAKMITPRDFYVDSDITKTLPLPPAAYTSKEFLEMELETIFKRNWIFIPQRSSEEMGADNLSLKELLDMKDQYSTFDLMGDTFRLWRGPDKKLRCFLNICTHQNSPLSRGAKIAREEKCDLHGRVFKSNGKCISHKGFPASRLADFGLPEFSVAAWNQFLFMCPSNAPACSFEETFAPINASFASLDVLKLERSHHKQEIRLLDGNWKHYIANFLDRFHLAFTHGGDGGLTGLLDLPSYKVSMHPPSSLLQCVYAKDPDMGIDPIYLPENPLYLPKNSEKNPNKRVFAIYWFVFPSTVIMLFAWGMAIYSFLPDVENPGKTWEYWYKYVIDWEKFRNSDDVWLHSQVNAEDARAMQQQYKAFKSRFAQRGQFSEDMEEGPRWFQSRVSEEVLGFSQ